MQLFGSYVAIPDNIHPRFVMATIDVCTSVIGENGKLCVIMLYLESVV